MLAQLGCLFLLYPSHQSPAQQGSPDSPGQPSLLMCADHYPPFTIYATPEGPPTGSVVLVVQELANSLGYALRFTASTPFKRCLAQLADGKADIMGGLLYSEERAEKMHLFRYLNYSTKSFYAVRQSPLAVHTFADLAGLTIGTTLGHQYWPAFDQEQQLFTKDSAAHVTDNFRKLMAGRLDLVVATERQVLFMLADNPDLRDKFKTMAYSYRGDNPVYIGLSRKSAAAGDHQRFAAMTAKLLEDNRFDKISQAFYARYFTGRVPLDDPQQAAQPASLTADQPR